MPQVTYRGSVADLQGTSWEVPATVLNAGQAGSWIESQARQAAAEQAAAAEADQRQRDLLAARLEQQRLAAEADVATPAPSRSELEAGLRTELSDLSQSVITAGAAIVGKAELVEAQTRDWTARHEALVATSEAAVSEAQAQVQAAQAVTQASSEQVQAELADHRLAVRSLENELRETVATLIGPQGQQGPEGIAGAATVLSTEDPLEVATDSFATRWLGRPLIDGDGVLVIRPNEILVRRWIGGGWSEGPAITPKQELIEAKVSAVNTGNTVFTMQNTTGAGGSGSGGDPLLVRSVAGATGGSMQLSDSSRWAIPLKVQGLASPTAAKLAIQLTAADGPQAGKNLFLVIGILYEPGSTAANSTRFSEYSVLGDLRPNLKVGFTIQLQSAGVPGGVSVAVPAGTNAAAVFMTITRNATGATSFIVSGACEWLLNQDNVPSSVRGSLQPAWQV